MRIVYVSKIDPQLLEFGPGKAMPISSKIVNSKNLLLEFNLSDVSVRCNLDHALFLSGTLGAKKLFAGAPIEPVICTKDTMKFEKKWVERFKKKNFH